MTMTTVESLEHSSLVTEFRVFEYVNDIHYYEEKLHEYPNGLFQLI